MTDKVKPMFRIRRIGTGQYRFELTGENRETLLYGVTKQTIKAAIKDVKAVRRVADNPDRIRLRKLNRRVFLLVTNSSGQAVASSMYFRNKDQAENAKKIIRKAFFDAVRKILTGRDGEYWDEYPNIETELRDAFRILSRDAFSLRLGDLVDTFGEDAVTTGLENIVATGGWEAAKATSAAAFLAPPPISVEQAAVSSEAVSTRIVAAYTLPGYADTAEREQLLIRLLADSDQGVAYRATVSAESMLSNDVLTLLSDISSGHASIYVRKEAARIIGQ